MKRIISLILAGTIMLSFVAKIGFEVFADSIVEIQQESVRQMETENALTPETVFEVEQDENSAVTEKLTIKEKVKREQDMRTNYIYWVDLTALPDSITPGAAVAPKVNVVDGHAIVTSVQWVDDYENPVTIFQNNKTYLLEVVLEAEEGYIFDDFPVVCADNVDAEYADGGDTICYAYFYYSLQPKVANIYLTVNTAQAGMNINQLTLTVDEGAAELDFIFVRDASTDRVLTSGNFISGKTYKVTYWLAPIPGWDFQEGYTRIANIEGAGNQDISWYFEDGCLCFDLYFSIAKPIYQVELTLNGMTPGAEIKNAVLSAEADALYAVESYCIYEIDTEEYTLNFQEDGVYEMSYEVCAKDGYCFTEYTEVYVNGLANSTLRLENGNVWIIGCCEYEFQLTYVEFQELPSFVKPGEAPDLSDVAVYSWSNTVLHDVQWVDSNKQLATILEEGKLYYLAATLSAKGVACFSGSTIDVEFDGDIRNCQMQKISNQLAVVYIPYAMIEKLSAPKVTVSGNALTWVDVEDADSYEIHRATKKTGTYTKVATVTTSNWSDASASVGKTYYYKVKAVYAADTSLNSDFSAVVSATAKCATPVITASNNSSGKPVVSWSKVSGAKQYTVYVATSQNGSYKKLGTTKSTTYTDAKAKAGTTYFYKVIANASKSTYNSGYSNIVSCGVICGTPTVTVKIDANTGKPSLSWKKVDGAAKYAIYRDGALLTTTTALTYADNGAAIDTQYTYTVQALGKTEDLNGNPSKEVSATSGIAKPTIKGSVDAVSGKPVLTWAAVEGAVKYEVYRSTKSNKSYSLVATVEELTYTDTSVSAGKTYYYQVKAVGEVSKSANSSYVKLTGKCATPAITVESNAKAQPVISWEKVSGAKKYTVYRSTSETSGYKSIGTSKTTSYTDTKATPGKVYYYKVIANASSSKYNSGYSNIVSCGVNCATPVVKVSNNANGKTVLTWSKVTGATKYEIYLLGAEDDVTLATVTGTTWTDADGVVGDGRYYGVRAIASAAEFSSEVSAAVFGKAIPATPKVSGKVGANKKPVLTWGEVEGAMKYIVYRSTKKDKGYTVIGESEVLTYEDLTAAKGKTYYYKVVAVGEGVQSAQSSYAKVKSK